MSYSCQDILPLAQKPVALQRRLGLLGQCLHDVPFRLFRRRLFHLKALFRRKSRFLAGDSLNDLKDSLEN